MVYFGCAGPSLLRWLSLAAGSGAALSLRYADSLFWWLPLLQSRGSGTHGLQWLQKAGSVAVAPRLWSTGAVVAEHGLSCLRPVGSSWIRD